MTAREEIRVLVVAPVGHDAAAMAEVLRPRRIEAEVCGGPAECLDRMREGAGLLLLTEEALELPGLNALLDHIGDQPAWSELPLIVLTSGGESRLAGLLELVASAAGTITLLERPISPSTLVRSVEVALRSRRRQYLVRDLMHEQERQRKALQESNERLRLAATAARLFAFEWDPVTDLVRREGNAQAVLGVPFQEETASSFFQRVHPDDRERFVRTVRSLHPGADAYTTTYRVLRPDGREGVLEESGRALFDDQGRFVRLIGMSSDITQRRRAEEELQQSREALEREHVVLEAVMNGATRSHLVYLDREFNFVRVNETYARSCGYSPAEMAGRNHFALFPNPENEAIFMRVRDTGEPVAFHDRPFEFLDQPERGTTYWDWTLTPVKGTAGEVEGLVFALYETTERKRAEAALEQARARSDLLARTMSTLLTAPDPQEVVEQVCGDVRELLGCEVSFNFLLDPVTRRLNLNACGGVDARLARKVEGLRLEESLCGTAAAGACRVLAEKLADSSDPRSTLVRSLGIRAYACHPLLGPDQEVLGTLSFGTKSRDAFSPEDLQVMKAVADHVAVAMLRRRSERALELSEHRLRLAKAAGRLGVHDYNPVTGELVWDERIRELWEIGPDDPATYEVFLSAVHPEDRAATDAAVQRALDPAGAGRLYVEYRLVHGARTRWIAATGQASFEEGRATRLIGTVQDITERKEFQAELERLVAERTAELRDLVGELEHFSYSITHDMRAPLRAMMGFAEVVQELGAEGQYQEQQVFLKRIATSARRMDLLITDALNYSRAVRNELPLAPVDVGRLLRGMLDTYPELQVVQADISVERNLPPVIGNEAGLTQCFSNLLENAVKFAKPGERAQVRVRSELRHGWVRLWVEDDGIGIPEKMLPRVFDMFCRGSSEQSGTGIGLALVRKVVNRMGGRVGVESEEGRGSRFWLELRPGDPRAGGTSNASGG